MKAVGASLLVFVGSLMVGFSDLFLRAQGLDGTNGIDCHSWDVYGTLVMLVGIIAFIFAILQDES